MEVISEEIKQMTSQLSSKQKEEIDLNKLKELVEKLKAQQVQMDFLKTKETEILKTEQLLKEYEYCLINFKNLFDRLDEVARRVLQLEKSIADEDFILNESTEQLLILEKEFEVLRTDYEHRDLLKQQAGELIKIARIIELNAENQKIGERVLKGMALCESSKDKVMKHKLLEGVIANELKTLKASLPDLAELSKIQNWFTIRKSLVAVELEFSKELNTIQKEIDILNNQFVESVEIQGGGLDKPLKIHDALELLTQKMLKTKSSISLIDKNIEHLLIRTKLEEYATNLEDGKPCPLCGSLSHPDILNSGDVKMALQKERDSKMKLEKTIESFEKLMVRLRQIETQLTLKLESVKKLKLKQVENQDKTAMHQTLFIWTDYRDELVLNKSFQSASAMQHSIKLKDGELEKLRIEVENELKLLENYNKGLDTIKEQQTINQSEIHLLTRQIEKLDLQAFILQSVDEVKQLSNRLLLKYAEIESAYLKTMTEIARLQKRRDESSGKLQVNRSMLLERQKEQIAVNDQINKLLSSSDYAFADQIKKILNQKIDIEVEKQKIQNFRQQFQLSENQLALLIIEIGDRTYLTDDHLKLKDEVLKLIEVQAEKNRDLGKTEGEIRKLTNDLNQQIQIRKSLDNFELRAEDIKTMKQLFKGSGFVNYVSSVHLHNLCLAANDRFYKLVRQKMSLEITQDNSFQVRDFLNGGKVRSVKTLSGGQTFQAALSLALSLADSIQQFTDSSQNFFFLDEGFGSLDKESLDVVFETLKSLRKENRIVGVISHVEEMQQEIDTHLRIVNDEETGSKVYRSWEN